MYSSRNHHWRTGKAKKGTSMARRPRRGIQRFLVVALYWVNLLLPPTNAVVHELTPQLAEQLRQQKKRRYFIKMDAGPCQDDNSGMNVCLLLDQNLWEPLSHANPQELWTRLDCEQYPDLCYELSTEARVQSIGLYRKVDFLTVAHSDYSPTSRLVELYRSGDTSMDKFVNYLREMIVRDLDFEAMHPDDVSAMLVEQHGGDVSRDFVPLTILVLTMQGFTHPAPWQRFLDLSKGQVRILMHQKSTTAGDDAQVSGIIQVPTIFSHRGTVALVRPVLQLLRFALAYGASSHYVLVSGDSVPLLSPHGMIDALVASNQSRFERHQQDQFKVAPELRLPYDHFDKSKNWIALTHEAATFFADPNHDETHNFEIVSMADEYYWINMAQAHNLTYANLPVMYDEWPVQQAERPNQLPVVNATIMGADGHLFARKVSKDTLLEIDWLSDEEASTPPLASSVTNEL